jgi:DNA mismatch endonuclease, patch repair protein
MGVRRESPIGEARRGKRSSMGTMLPKVGASSEAQRLHQGDIMSPEKRSALMSRIRGRDTKPEKAVETMLRGIGVSFETHCRDLPGRPDFVLRQRRIAIFIDGDFWHGWRFPAWRLKLSEKWEKKIESNRLRDARINRKLRRQGWKVVRIWEHQIEKHPEVCVTRIKRYLATDLCNLPQPGNLI